MSFDTDNVSEVYRRQKYKMELTLDGVGVNPRCTSSIPATIYATAAALNEKNAIVNTQRRCERNDF